MPRSNWYTAPHERQMAIATCARVYPAASRQQPERWEPIVADAVRGDLERPRRQLDAIEIWRAEFEHHFALIAARNLFHALDLPPASAVAVDATLRDELIEGRDLHEHWK